MTRSAPTSALAFASDVTPTEMMTVAASRALGVTRAR
jgi:hypothetical protein